MIYYNKYCLYLKFIFKSANNHNNDYITIIIFFNIILKGIILFFTFFINHLSIAQSVRCSAENLTSTRCKVLELELKSKKSEKNLLETLRRMKSRNRLHSLIDRPNFLMRHSENLRISYRYFVRRVEHKRSIEESRHEDDERKIDVEKRFDRLNQ